MVPAARPAPSRIYILDLDGTLLPTHELDNVCYWKAVHEVFGTRPGTVPLTTFVHVTDPGILLEWCQHQVGRPPTKDEVDAVRRQFLGYIEREAERDERHFQPTHGLRRWLRHVADEGAAVAIATGGWGHTARFKLERSGLDAWRLPLASADDRETRTEIMQLALEWVLRSNPAEVTPTYIGDGPWDATAARELGWGFIGIASGRRAEVLRGCGARQVHADFSTLC
ncbi:MAG: HAD family hydrolase [Gammaproteobacteria bacterium]